MRAKGDNMKGLHILRQNKIKKNYFTIRMCVYVHIHIHTVGLREGVRE
jgi:hypothetical protein